MAALLTVADDVDAAGVEEDVDAAAGVVDAVELEGGVGGVELMTATLLQSQCWWSSKRRRNKKRIECCAFYPPLNFGRSQQSKKTRKSDSVFGLEFWTRNSDSECKLGSRTRIF